MLLTWGIMPDSDSNSSQSFELRTKDGTNKKAKAQTKKQKPSRKKKELLNAAIKDQMRARI